MEIENQEEKKSWRQLMPPNYIPILMSRTGLTKKAVYEAVKYERSKSKAYHAIMQLAKEHVKIVQTEQHLTQ